MYKYLNLSSAINMVSVFRFQIFEGFHLGQLTAGIRGSQVSRHMKHHVAVKSARERYISRREEIPNNFLRIFARRLMYWSCTLLTAA